jgi:hypothetical protein
MQDEFVPPERIGFVGLGNMGAPMARHLAAAGFHLVAADSNPAALERFCGTVPCERAGSLVDLGRSCRLVITMLPDGQAVRQVLLGADGVAAGLAPGSVALDMSSAEPVGTRALAAQLADARSRWWTLPSRALNARWRHVTRRRRSGRNRPPPPALRHRSAPCACALILHAVGANNT